MVYRVEITTRASSDLIDIFWLIQAIDSPTALAWFDGLEEMIHSLEKQPRRGMVTVESSTFRQLLYGTKPRVYRIIYEIDETARIVHVLHIRHGARAAFEPHEI